MWQLLASTGEPAILLGAINAGIVLAVSFGTRLSAEQIAAINAFAAAIIAVLIRQTVTPIQQQE